MLGGARPLPAGNATPPSRSARGGPPGVPASGGGRQLAVDPAPDHLDHVGPLVAVEPVTLRDAVPRLHAAAAAGGGGVLGHVDRVVAVGGLPALVARLGR